MSNSTCNLSSLQKKGAVFTRANTLAISVALICSTQAFAQSNTLESILVTADRQQSELSNIPLSIFSVDDLDKVGATHINEALAQVPGTWISRGNGQEHLTAIRSPVLTGAGSCGAFQMSQDGIPLRAAGFCNVNQLFEANTEQAASIEVIRGPGSVLYGANALHGTINVISPGISEELGGDLSIEVGEHSYKRAKVSVSSTRDRQGVRLSFNGVEDGGYKRDSGFAQQKLSFLHQYKGNEVTVTSGFDATNLNQETAGYVKGAEAYKEFEKQKDNPNPEAFRDAESYRLRSRIEWGTDNTQWMLMPYYRKTDMNFLMHFLPGAPLEENGQESFGFQSMFSSLVHSDLQVIFGIDGELTEGFLRQTQAGIPDTDSAFLKGTLPVGKQYDFDVDAQMLSAYAQFTYQASPKNQLTLGARTEYLSYDYTNNLFDGRSRDDGTNCGFGGCRYSRPADRDDSFTNHSLQLGWIHDLSDHNQTFVNLSHAFRAPQANEMYRLQNDQEVADLESEEVDSFELGYRASYDKVNYAVSLFYMTKDNVIFQDSDRNNVSNGETKHRGLELNITYNLRDNLKLSASGSYARHTYEANIAPRGVDDEVIIDGNYIDTAPKVSANVQLAWQIDTNNSASLEWVHMGSYFTEPTNMHEYDGHELVNLRIHTKLNNGWLLGARITNLLGADYAERADFAFGQDRYFVGEPRSFYLSIGSRF